MENKQDKPEGVEYWSSRPIDDPRKDWRYDGNQSWVEEYWGSQGHPHRPLLMEEFTKIPFDSVLELGCNCGPNLAVVKELWPQTKLAGIDLNPEAIKFGKEAFALADLTSQVDLRVGNIQDPLPFKDKNFDIILADAVLMYIEPDKIESVISEMKRVAKKAVILVEWDGKDKLGEINYHHWCRDYKGLLEDNGFKVDKIKIPAQLWPSKNWSELGHIYVALLP